MNVVTTPRMRPGIIALTLATLVSACGGDGTRDPDASGQPSNDGSVAGDSATAADAGSADSATGTGTDAGAGADAASASDSATGTGSDAGTATDAALVADAALVPDATLFMDAALDRSEHVHISIDNFCRVSVSPQSFTVPAGGTLRLAYHNHSVDYEADVWLSYGGGYLELARGGTWNDRFVHCATPLPYTAYADIDIAGGPTSGCPGFRLLINCQ